MKTSRPSGCALFLLLVAFATTAPGGTRVFDTRVISALEPSGAVWHPEMGTLLVASDTGWLLSIRPDGGTYTAWRVEGNLEGVTVADPESDLVYLGTENPNSVKEFDLRSGAVTRTFDLEELPQPKDPNKGLEALTFVPSNSAEGGSFYIGMQEDGAIYVFELPVRTSSSSSASRLVRTIAPVAGLDDISGLDYHRHERVLYAIHDEHDCIRALGADGSPIAEWPLPKDHQEGIALDGNDLYIAQDNGKVWRYDLAEVRQRREGCRRSRK